MTTLSGGSIVAENGVHLPENHKISGRGLIYGPISGPGTLTPSGVFDVSAITPLTLDPGDYLTILTTNRVALSEATPQDIVLNGGTLRAPGGFVIETGDRSRLSSPCSQSAEESAAIVI